MTPRFSTRANERMEFSAIELGKDGGRTDAGEGTREFGLEHVEFSWNAYLIFK